MNLIVSGVRNAVQVRMEQVLNHIPCHSAAIKIRHPDHPEITIHAAFSPAPHPCWMIGVAGKPQQASEYQFSPDYSLQIENDASVEVVTEDGDITPLY